MNSEIEARIAALEARADHAEAELKAAAEVIGNLTTALKRAHECESATAEAMVLHRRALEALGVSFERRTPPATSGSVQ